MQRRLAKSQLVRVLDVAPRVCMWLRLGLAILQTLVAIRREHGLLVIFAVIPGRLAYGVSPLIDRYQVSVHLDRLTIFDVIALVPGDPRQLVLIILI